MAASVPTEHLLAALAVTAAVVLLLRAVIWRWLRRAAPGEPRPARTGRKAVQLAVAALCLALLGGLAVALATGLTAPLDAAVNAFFVPYRAPWLLSVFVWITSFGTGAALIGVAVTATGLLWAGGRSSLVVLLWTVFLGAEATTWAAKYIIARPRPAFLPGVASALSPAFPSAHATGTMAMIGVVAYAVARDLPCLRARFEVAFWAAIAVALIGFSRIFLSLHYVTDVASGFLVGGFWLLVGPTLAGVIPVRQGAPTAVQARPDGRS